MRPVVGAGGGDWGAGSVELSRAQLLGKVSAAKVQNKLGAGANAVQTILKKKSQSGVIMSQSKMCSLQNVLLFLKMIWLKVEMSPYLLHL